MHQTSRSSYVRSLIAPLALTLSLAPRLAAADTKSCVASHASAQREAKAGRVKEAAQLYTACGSDSACPEQLRSECATLLEQVRNTVPSVIFSAIDAKGADVSNVKVYADDTLLADGLDGRAIELDPGKYHLRMVLPDNSVLSSDVLIREGEKNRLVEMRAPEEKKALPAASAPAAAPPPVDTPPKPVEKSTPVAAWVATGVAVVGFGTFGTFALLGSSDKKKLDDCAPSCPDSAHGQRDSLKTKYLIADVGLGVGVASAVLAGVLFLSSGPSESERVAHAQPRGLLLNASPGGGQLLWRGQF